MRSRPAPAALVLALLAACSSAPAPETRPAPAGTGAPIVATVDLVNVDNDRVRVVVDPGPLPDAEVLYRLPRVVQGTYAISDFGRFTEGFEALDASGASLPAERLDQDTWRIAGAARLDRVRYWVNDTYNFTGDPPAPFSPSGTNIDPDNFLLNLHGFVGYFEGKTDLPYEIRVTAPADAVGSSALPLVGSRAAADGRQRTDTYRAGRYFEVTDNPLMYGAIDTASVQLPGIRVVLSVYSPTGKHRAADLLPAMERMMRAQKAYLGDFRTTERYDVFLYLMSDALGAGLPSGALEHHRSTVATFPESLSPEELESHLVHTISHEFFHIVSPLSVHSEDIHEFDYHDPTFSKHLWMYEGQTEYFANHFQVYEGLIDRPAFYALMAEKVDESRQFADDMSFTTMSEHIVEPPYEENYGNVYQKGALIGMCLDVMIRSSTGGERSLIGLMNQLGRRYGTTRPFPDDSLIAIVTDMTTPAVGRFLRTHVEGGTPIDYAACLRPVGLTVATVPVKSTLFFRSATWPFVNINARGEIYVRNLPLSSSLDAMGARSGDVIRSVNGVPYTVANLQDLVTLTVQSPPETVLTMVVERDGREVTLTGPIGTPTAPQTTITEDPAATAAQRALRDAWLGG